MIRAAVVLLALLPAARVAAETVALTGGTVHTVSGATLENATVVIENGVIASVGSDTPPAGARVVDVRGKHVYPGLVSANTILGLTEVGSVRGTNDYEETGPTNPNIRAEVQINPDSDLLAVTKVAGVTTALVAPRGGAVAGTSAVVHLDGWTFEDMTLRAPAGLHVRWPALAPSTAWNETRSEEQQKKEREEALENIRRAFDDGRAYWTARDAEKQGGIPRHDRDVKWDAMARALKGEIPVMFHASTLAQIRGALEFADRQKLTNVVLVGGADAWHIADELRRRDVAVICDPTLALPRRTYEPYDQAFTLPERLHRAGVRFCVADNGGAMAAANARNLPHHAAMAAAFGLPRDEALRAITLYPAQILGVADRVGSIEPGKTADLVVANGDLLEITTRVEQVYVAGRLLSMENRQTRLFEKYDARPRGALARQR